MEMPPQVSESKGRVILGKTPKLTWEVGKNITFIGALEAALVLTERPHEYVDLMGWSGLAFRLRRFEGDNGQRGSTSEGVGEFPEVFQAIEATTGLRIQNLVEMGHYGDAYDMSRYKGDIVASIDQGVPLLAYTSYWDVGVITGYADEGQTVLFNHYNGPETFVPINELGPMLMLIQEVGEPLTPRQSLLSALRLAVANWRRDPEYYGFNGGHYYYGNSGFRKWSEHLSLEGDGSEVLGSTGRAHGFVMACLHDSRKAASAFLTDHAELVADHRAKQLLIRAADAYRREADRLGDGSAWNEQTPDEFQGFLDQIQKLESEAISYMAEALDIESHGS